MRLQHNSLPFLPLARVLLHCDSGMRRNQKGFERKSHLRLQAFRFLEFCFFRLSFFCFSFLFVAVIDLLLCLLAVKKLLRKRHRDGQSLAWMEKLGVEAGNFSLSFSLIFLSIFVHIQMMPISEHYWKDLFLLHFWTKI